MVIYTGQNAKGNNTRKYARTHAHTQSYKPTDACMYKSDMFGGQHRKFEVIFTQLWLCNFCCNANCNM